LPARREWVFDPHAGGQRIPEAVQADVRRRIERAAEKHLNGDYLRLDLRFRGQFCYIDAFREVKLPKGARLPKGWPETRAQYQERLRNTPIHLCRLRYLASGHWSYPICLYSHERYEPTYFPGGDPLGQPEAAFLGSRQLLSEAWLTVNPVSNDVPRSPMTKDDAHERP
jgi:hypothetical protein